MIEDEKQLLGFVVHRLIWSMSSDAQMVYINATTSIPAMPATATWAELRDAAPLSGPAVEDEALESEAEEDDDEDEDEDDEPDEAFPVAVAVALPETWVTRLPVAPIPVVWCVAVMVAVWVMVSSVIVLVMVEVWVMVVVPRGSSCARARRGRRAAERMLVNCMVRDECRRRDAASESTMARLCRGVTSWPQSSLNRTVPRWWLDGKGRVSKKLPALCAASNR